jgi:hypothetical protein
MSIRLPFAQHPPARATMVLQARTAPRPPAPAPAGTLGRFRYDEGCTPQQLAVLAQLDVFFTDDRLQLHRSIQQRRASSRDVSLRTLDWLVTNYSKKNLVRVVSLGGVPRDMHNAYRETLDFYGRPLFDPFRRGTRVHFTWGKDTLYTTCGQLNFFRFMIYCGVLDYALKHAVDIENDMMKTLARAKQERAEEEPQAKRRRIELTPSNPTRIHIVRL